MHMGMIVNEVAYLSGKVTKILLNSQIKNKKKHRLSEVIIGRGQSRGHGCERWKSDSHDKGGVHGICGHRGVGLGGDLDCS